MLSFSSQNPISVVQGGSTITYDKWTVKSVNASITSEGKVSLTLLLVLSNDSGEYQPSTIVCKVDDLIGDSSLSQPSIDFFQALMTKLVNEGTIS